MQTKPTLQNLNVLPLPALDPDHETYLDSSEGPTLYSQSLVPVGGDIAAFHSSLMQQQLAMQQMHGHHLHLPMAQSADAGELGDHGLFTHDTFGFL